MVRVKIVAVLLGPEGVGITSQINTLINSLTVLLYLGLGPGVVKFLAEANAQQDADRLQRVAVTSSATVVMVSLAGTVVAVLLSAPLTRLTLGDRALRIWVVLGVLAVPLAALSGHGKVLLQGFKQVRPIAVAGVLSTLISFATVVPLVYYLRVTGAVINIGIAWAANAGLFWWFYGRVQNRPAFRFGAFDLDILRQLIAYGAATLAVNSGVLLTALAIRSRIIAVLGVEQNGLYQAVYALSLQYMTVVTGAMGTYSLAHLAELGERDLIAAEVNNNLRLILLIMTPLLGGVLILREVGLVVLYSRAFLPAAGLFPLQVLGDFFQACAFAMSVALIPLGRVRAHVGVNLTPMLLYLAAALSLLPVLGLQAVVLSYAASMLVQAALGLRYLRRAIALQVAYRNRALFTRSLWVLLALAGITLIPASPGVLAARAAGGALILALWARFALTKNERDILKEALRTRLGHRRVTPSEEKPTATADGRGDGFRAHENAP